MRQYYKPDSSSAIDAKTEALKIAFSPVVFQVTYALVELGILDLIGDQGDSGITAEEIAKCLDVSVYGVKVLLDVGLSCNIVWLNNDKYALDKVGFFILTDKMVRVNLNFIQDVCYQGLFKLLESIKTGKPEGLKVFGDWKTIYPALYDLPKSAKKSWFEFDHYYSDKAFPKVLPIIFSKPVKRLFDVGGNTGKWTLQCLDYDSDVHVTIVDLPQELNVANKIMVERGYADRVDTCPVDMLDPSCKLPTGPDVIWMSQFLDCFSEAEIVSILERAAAVMTPSTRLYILELFWDRQMFEGAAFSVNCTSLYFTCMANGNSRMYRSKDLIRLIDQAGLYVDEDVDHIGAGHTLLGCKLKSADSSPSCSEAR